MNKLYFGDNLEIMREMEPGHIDLICTDPPFNSGRDYNAFFQESKAQEKAFDDIWEWDNRAIEYREDIKERASADETYKALDMCLQGYDLVLQKAVSGNKGAMRAYLAFMGPRLIEMHRILKDTGSIYLHCDPTASHYLKSIMDAVFDVENYRNEIVWGYSNSGRPKRFFAKKHDTILLYTKTDRGYWGNYKMPISEEYLESHYRQVDDEGRRCRIRVDAGKKRYYYPEDGMTPNDWWKDIPSLNSVAKERLGYPTQKPLILYERMIEASSNTGDLVMDPFCGCGTTIDAAHTLKRNWIGIDLTIIALDPISKRMRDRHANNANEPLQPHKDYAIIGYPTNMQEVYKLVRNEKKRHDFANWAVTRLGMIPTPDTGDGGKDGIGTVMLWDPDTEKQTAKRIISEVKTGKFSINDVRAFCHTINEQDAIAGVFITLESISDGMRQIAEDMGKFELENNKDYPRLQFWQITNEYFEYASFLKENIKLPYDWIIPRKKSERHFDNEQGELF